MGEYLISACLPHRAFVVRNPPSSLCCLKLLTIMRNEVCKTAKKGSRDEASLACEPHHGEFNGEAAIVQAELSREQAEVLAAMENGDSVFFTSFAGTGKTFLMELATQTLQ